ncbi:MAG: heparan-alpha-glucosaminide N-acetyltransferase [Methanocorpusculum sp.]|nr:heparan-alpha-glucosaminide N-acetyltransferase [Methanocorpusculum sp.]
MGRYWELDAGRGVAILLMIGYHILFQLSFFAPEQIPWFNPYVLTGAPIAFLFVTIAGISLVLFTAKEENLPKTAKKMVVRGIYILCFAAVITAASWMIFPSEVVVFGILHLIGCATILAIPFVVLKIRSWITLGFGLIVIAISPLLAYVRGPAYLIPFGITPVGFATLDYEPLIPWFGMLLIGVALGSVLYKGGVRCKALERLGEMPKAAVPVAFLGRHSLLIYLIHNPIIFGILFAAGFVSV